MDSQESANIVTDLDGDGDDQNTWRRVLAGLKPRDHHVTTDEIFEILNNADDAATAILCDAKGITVPMYCVWKSRYQHLRLDELRKARRREQWRRQSLLGALLAAAVLATAGIVLGLARAVYATI